MKKLRVKLVKSGIGQPERQKRTLQALGFSKMQQTLEKTATPQILGMLRKVEHLVTVEEI